MNLTKAALILQLTIAFSSSAFSNQPFEFPLTSDFLFQSLVQNGTPLPADTDFPIKEYYFKVGPHVYMTAAHVIAYHCPSLKDHPYRMGEPLMRPSGRVFLMGTGYCEDDDKHLNNDKTHGGYNSDWALIYDPQVNPKGPMLTLDFTPPHEGEVLVLVSTVFRNAGLEKVTHTESQNIALKAFTKQPSQPGDSGSPYLRVAKDKSVSVAAVHSTGDHSTELGGALFQSETDRQAIRRFTKLKNVQICGVNLDCSPVLLPVKISRLK